MLRSLEQIFRSYALYGVIIELAVIWLGVYMIFRFLRGTRGAGVIKGFLVLLVFLTLAVRVIGQDADALGRLHFLYNKFLGLLAILLIVVFQPELRRAMIRIGHAPLFRSVHRDTMHVVDSVAEAVEFLSKSQFGALIAIERDVGLRALVEGGVQLDAEVSAQLLESIFWPNSPLHDLGVVIRNNRVAAASVQFPLAEGGTLPPEFGARHRAAVGLSLESDCIIVIVSEETGAVSIAENGRVVRNIPHEKFRDALLARLEAPRQPRETQREPQTAPALDHDIETQQENKAVA